MSEDRDLAGGAGLFLNVLFPHKMVAGHKELKKKIEEMEEKYDEQFRVVFDAIRQLLEVDGKLKRRIGF